MWFGMLSERGVCRVAGSLMNGWVLGGYFTSVRHC